MSWYRTGTIAVTNGSTTVTGSGTNFLSDDVQVGFGFIGPDGALYEITAVVSATELTLASAYLGATSSGQAYVIFPTRSLTADLIASVQALITDYQTVRDQAGAGLFGDGTLAAPGLAFLNDQNTGLHRPAADQVAAVVGGLQKLLLSTAAFQVDVPLTGAAVQASATDTTAGRLMRADYGYGPGNLLGTVSESGGTPTGAVIERGSNANGTYIRFADGTQICTSPTFAGDATTAVGSLYRWAAAQVWAFPAAFSATPQVMPGNSNNSTFCLPTAHAPTATLANVNLLSSVSLTGRSAVYAAIGRWF